MRGMICDSCGKEYDGPGVPYTRSIDKGFTAYWLNRTVRITICPECAESRRKMPGFIVIVICIALFAAVIICSLLN
jgi:hypothetical protein